MYKHSNFLRSLASALRGIGHGFTGRNFKIQIAAGIVALVLTYYLPLSAIERAIIIALVGLVLAAELFNSAIEELADVLIQEHHPGIARVKELSAAAVLVLSVAAAIIGLPIFISHMI